MVKIFRSLRRIKDRINFNLETKLLEKRVERFANAIATPILETIAMEWKDVPYHLVHRDSKFRTWDVEFTGIPIPRYDNYWDGLHNNLVRQLYEDLIADTLREDNQHLQKQAENTLEYKRLEKEEETVQQHRKGRTSLAIIQELSTISRKKYSLIRKIDVSCSGPGVKVNGKEAHIPHIVVESSTEGNFIARKVIDAFLLYEERILAATKDIEVAYRINPKTWQSEELGIGKPHWHRGYAEGCGYGNEIDPSDIQKHYYPHWNEIIPLLRERNNLPYLTDRCDTDKPSGWKGFKQ